MNTNIAKSTSLTRQAIARKQAGVSFVTVGIVIAVGGIILLGAVTLGPRYLGKAKVQNEVTSIADLKTGVVAYAGRVGIFTTANVGLDALVGQNFFPPATVSGTAALPVVTNQWGGSITSAVGTTNTAGDSIDFTTTAVPASACTEVGTSVDGIVSKIVINTTTTKAVNAQSVSATVNSSCVGDNNSMTYTIAK